MKRSCMTTLCYLETEDSYLMLHRIRKKEDVNKGKWIGVGGHFEEGESPEDCLLREVREETGLVLTSWRFRGAGDIHPGRVRYGIYVPLYRRRIFGNAEGLRRGRALLGEEAGAFPAESVERGSDLSGHSGPGGAFFSP